MVYSGSQLKRTIHYGGEGRQDRKSFKHTVVAQLRSRSSDDCVQLFSSLSPRTQSGIPGREWGCPQWSGLLTSSGSPPQACPETHLPDDCGFSQAENTNSLDEHFSVDCISFERLKIQCLNRDIRSICKA